MQAERNFRLERVGPVQIVRYYADGFDQLSRTERIFVYYLSLAAIAGRDIAIDQRHRDALEVRDVFEQLLLHHGGIDSHTFSQISDYVTLFWINNGWYDNHTSRKFVPEISFEQFTEACRHAEKNGASFILGNESLDEKLRRLRDIVFTPGCDGLLTNKTPGEDWIASSAVNYYERGLSYDEVNRWADGGSEHYPLNSTVARANGSIFEDIWRAGDDTHPPGKYSAALTRVIEALELAIPYASSSYQAISISKLIKFLRSGDPDDFRDYNIHWIRDASRVDFNLGFIEVYLDPRSQKGEWQASIYMRNEAQTGLMQVLANHAQYFEDNAPWHVDFKKQIGQLPVANAVDALMQTGGTGPISPVGINLPNEQSIRQQFGSKSILLHNIGEATDKAMGFEMAKEFGFDDEEIDCEMRYGTAADNLLTALHEVIGHGSGKMKAGLEGRNPSEMLPGYYSTIEEARADCVALWYAWDPELVGFGVVRSAGELELFAKTMYRQLFRGALTQLRQIGRQTQLEEDHMKNRQLIAGYALRHSDGVRIVHRDGKSYCHIVDFAATRKSLGTLLSELTRIKCEGDAEAARHVVDSYGLRVDASLRDEIQSRAARLDVPLYIGFVQPKFEPIFDASGQIADVKLTYPGDIASQMLEFSAYTRGITSTDRQQ